MRFTWHEKKRRTNLKDHGLDFVDAPRVFEGPTFTFEDERLTTQRSVLSRLVSWEMSLFQSCIPKVNPKSV